MPQSANFLAPLRPLLARAVFGYLLLRALLVVSAALAAAFLGDAESTRLTHPVGVVLLATLVDVVDIRRRGESLLWANLGYSARTTAGLFAAVAIIAELLLTLRTL